MNYRVISTLLVIAPCLALGVRPGFAGHGLPHATVRIWDILPHTGPDPSESVEDIDGVTQHVATPANPLTVVTVIENTSHGGGPCGVIYWNPATNFFKWYGFGGGFQSGVDANLSAPPKTDSLGKTFGPGDVWIAKSGCPAFLMNFKGSDDFRSYGTFSTFGTQVDQATGDVWLTEIDSANVSRLDPATNALTRWNLGGGARPYYLAVDASSRAYATVGCTDEIVRVDPATDSVTRWAVPGGGLTCFFSFETPNGVAIDQDGRVWFAESDSNQIGRLDPATNEICEFTKSGLTDPQLVASSGSSNSLQTFFAEGSGNAVGIVTQVEADALGVGTCTTVAPSMSTVMPSATTVTFTDFTEQTGLSGCPCGSCVSPSTATILPATFDVEGVDGTPSGNTKTSDGIPIPAVLRFPMPGFSNFPSGMTGVAAANTVYGGFLGTDKVFEVLSTAIIAPPPAKLSAEAFTASARLASPGVSVPKVAQAAIPSSGGSDMNEIVSLSIGTPPVDVAVGKNTANGSSTGPDDADSTATSLTTGIKIDLSGMSGPVITAEELKAVATCDLSETGATSSSAGTQFVGLSIDGSPVVPDPVSPTVIPLGIGTLTLREETTGGDGVTSTEFTVNMIHLRLDPAMGSPVDADLIVASAHCDVGGSLKPKQTACCQSVDPVAGAPVCSEQPIEQCAKGGGTPVVSGVCGAGGLCAQPPPPPELERCCQFQDFFTGPSCDTLPETECREQSGNPVTAATCNEEQGKCVSDLPPAPIPVCCEFQNSFGGQLCAENTLEECQQLTGNPVPGATCDSSTQRCKTPVEPEICCELPDPFGGTTCNEKPIGECQAEGGTAVAGGVCDQFARKCRTPDQFCCQLQGQCAALSIQDCQAQGGTPAPGFTCDFFARMCEITPPPGSVCCQFESFCSESPLESCVQSGGTPGAGSCDVFIGRCLVAPPPPPVSPAQNCCQLENNACSSAACPDCLAAGGQCNPGGSCDSFSGQCVSNGGV